MKTIKTMVLAVAIICGTALNANTTEPTEPTSKTTSKVVKTSMKNELGKLLSDSELKLDEELAFKVTFTLNEDNEVVVLKVDTKDKAVERFIQSRLNYKKLEAVGLVGQTYYLPVRMEASL